jgi:hypothetical protein
MFDSEDSEMKSRNKKELHVIQEIEDEGLEEDSRMNSFKVYYENKSN